MNTALHRKSTFKVKNVLIRSFSYFTMVLDFVKNTTKCAVKTQQRAKGEVAHYCQLCEVVFACQGLCSINKIYLVRSIQCAFCKRLKWKILRILLSLRQADQSG